MFSPIRAPSYGLVETPRAVWINSYPDKALARLEYAYVSLCELSAFLGCPVTKGFVGVTGQPNSRSRSLTLGVT